MGETLSDALRREVEEETGWTVAVERLVDFFEYVERDPEDRVVYHYVVADFCCRYRAGRLRAGSDVSDARLVPVDEIENYDLNSEAMAMIRKALESA